MDVFSLDCTCIVYILNNKSYLHRNNEFSFVLNLCSFLKEETRIQVLNSYMIN